MSANIITGGTITVELDVGFGDGFLLDDTQQGVLDNTTYLLDGSNPFREITVNSIEIQRGKKNVIDSITPGRLSVLALDPQRLFDPYNQASPYYDEADNLPGLAPMRQIRVKRDSTYIFRGRVVDFNYSYVGPGQIPRVVINAADDFFLLSNTFLTNFTPSSEISSTRLNTILNRPEVDYPSATRDISTGTTTLGAYQIDEGANVLEYIRKIDSAERGRIFVRPSDGDLVFQPRVQPVISNPVVLFSDTGSDISYKDVFVDFTTELVFNRVTVQRTGGTAQTVEDTASIATYFIQAQTLVDSLLSTDAQALDLANYLIAGQPIARLSGIETFFGSIPLIDQSSVVAIDIGDLISVTRTFSTGSPTTVTEILFVEGISHLITLQGETMKFYTAPTTVLEPFILDINQLDDPLYGLS